MRLDLKMVISGAMPVLLKASCGNIKIYILVPDLIHHFISPKKPCDSASVNFMAPLQLYPDLENDHKMKRHVPGSANNLCTVVAGPRWARFRKCTSNSGGGGRGRLPALHGDDWG